MSVKVARTCTVIDGNAGDSIRVDESLPISELSSVPAYVLLGDPGAGKTTEFLKECETSKASGVAARYETARDFITLDVGSHPEWRDRILFIDGLDEMRAGSTDAHSPLDRIRNRLDRLGPPGFRISCREADWLGLSDRQSLARVSPGQQVVVARLDPLDENSIREILRSLVTSDSEDFINEARLRGIRPLLENPLTLELLAGAVCQGSSWPDSRRQLFEMACEDLLATEHNVEHQVVASSQPVETIMDTAGHLCALQLLAGIEGFTLSPQAQRESFVPLTKLDKRLDISNRVAEQVLATRLFTAVGERAFRPHHRHVAEFLAGRYLANLVDCGLPARRVTALMTSPADGRVVTELRGLSAWLAVHPGETRRLLIDADPVGVGLYGDIGGFSRDDKSKLIASLANFAAESALFGHEWRDGRESGFRDNTAWSFRSLASAELVNEIKDVVRSDTDNRSTDRVVEFVLQVVSEAPESELRSLAPLAPDLDAIVRDTARSSGARLAALDAYLHVAPFDESKTQFLRNLLESFQTGILPDPDYQLRGTLLEYLYPTEVTPTEVWDYAVSRDRINLIGRFRRFWKRSVVEKLTCLQVAELLDDMGDGWSLPLETLQRASLKDIPIRLLARGLETMGDELEGSRLYKWLSAVQRPTRGAIRRGSDVKSGGHAVGAWLEARPQLQKQLYLEWLRQIPDGPNWRYKDRSGDVRCASRPPPDFGLWCLEQAIRLYSAEPTVAKRLLESAYLSLNDPMTNGSLTEELIVASVEARPALSEHLREIRELRRSSRISDQEYEQELDILKHEQDKEERELRDEWEGMLRSHESALRSNTFSPPNLHTLALVYSGEIQTHLAGSPRERVAGFIGGDPRLVDAVMAALRGAVLRNDLPTLAETISLRSQSREPWLAMPVLVSMDLLVDEPEIMVGIKDRNKRRALALYYCSPFHCQVGEGKGVWSCHDSWLDQHPGLVLDVLYRCAVTALRAGSENLPGVDELDRVKRHHALVQATRLKLLEAFPTRIPSLQLRQFDQLLASAFAHSDHTPVMMLADKKLSKKSLSVAHRIRWMTVEALLSGGAQTERLRIYAGANERRTRRLAEFLHHIRDHPDRRSRRFDRADSELVGSLIEMLGRSFGPQRPDGFITVDVSTSGLVSGLISQLGSMADAQSLEILASLVNDPLLARWRDHLIWSQEQQRALHRDISYSHPDIAQVLQALNGQAPANAADLAALLSDLIETIADHIRGDSANPWRQFWNEDSHGRPKDPKPEDSCRDALIQMLKARLPTGVDVAPEGRYAAEKRADIRASHAGHNVPIEIKKNSHRDLWSALRRQLIGQYTTDPATSGYGIYLVLWFRPDKTTPPPDGPRPATPEELRGMLEKELTADEARKISVIVMDITRP
ncbi:MAG: hypothetical protein OXF41_19730 [bacterium]|nr:hypothetical protein [bacterium]